MRSILLITVLLICSVSHAQVQFQYNGPSFKKKQKTEKSGQKTDESQNSTGESNAEENKPGHSSSAQTQQSSGQETQQRIEQRRQSYIYNERSLPSDIREKNLTMEQFYAGVPAMIKHRLDSARKLVIEGTEKGEIYFANYYMYAKTGGIVPQLLYDAKFCLDLMDMIRPANDSASYKNALDHYNKNRAEIMALENSLKESELLKQQLKGVYNGQDKDQIKSIIKKAWEKDHPGKVYAVVITETKWMRETYKGYKDQNMGGGQWFDYDNSWINAAVAIKKDDTTAEVYVLEIGKNHKKGGQFIEDSFTATKFKPKQYLLRNIQP